MMFNVAKDGKTTIQIGQFYVSDYIENDLLDIVEDFSCSILQNIPACIWIQTSENEYYIICNINECYILDVNRKKIKKEKVSLIEIGKNLYNDLNKCRKNILELNEVADIDEVENILNLNLETMIVCNSILKEDFYFKKGNITQTTLESLNYALYLHSSGLVYDTIDNEEIFRLYDYDRTYVIIIKKKKNNNTKAELLLVNKSLDQVAIETYISLIDKKKMKRTKELLDELYNNILEYHSDFPQMLEDISKEKTHII